MIRAIFAANVLFGAFLMFQIEPLVGKIVTAEYGGGSGIWTACLMFFQLVLLTGYLISLILSRLPVSVQTTIYPLAMAASAISVSSLTHSSWSGADQALPIASILQLLTTRIGLPFLLLSTVSGTLQNWYRLAKLGNPYPLYALSNLGSLVALLSYPTLFEPALSVSQTLTLWTSCYWLIVLISCLASFYLFTRNKTVLKSAETEDKNPELLAIAADEDKNLALATAAESAGQGVAPATTAPTASEGNKVLSDYALWISMSALGSITLIADTAYLTQNVAPMPLLWVLPLSAYLISFILVFASDRFNKPVVFAFAAPMLWMLGSLLSEWSVGSLATDIAFIFCCCCTCHGLIAASRPEPKSLPAFYLAISLGGALGGIFENFVAPMIFNTYAELFGVLLSMIIICTSLAMRSLKGQLSKTWIAWGYLLLFIAITVCGQIVASSQHILFRKRNFYGCLTVRSISTTRMLANGITLHGVQYTSEANRRTPTSYYAINTGCGATDFLLRQRFPDKPLRYGLVGLGIGTIACYGERGDQFTFYEIDPKVKNAAEEYFTFLKDSKAAIKVVLGDARISLAKEKANQYDLLVVDAFSGDSIPVHLLTREAMQIYLRQIKPDGVILFHISNRHVNLEPVIAKLAESANLKSYVLLDPKSKYAAVTAGSLYDDPKQLTGRAQFANLTLTKLTPDPNFKCWSDDYSNLFSVIKF